MSVSLPRDLIGSETLPLPIYVIEMLPGKPKPKNMGKVGFGATRTPGERTSTQPRGFKRAVSPKESAREQSPLPINERSAPQKRSPKPSDPDH